MKLAVITASGTQIPVQEGQSVQLDRIDQKEGSAIEFPDVLLVVNDDTVEVGQPAVSGSKVIGEVVSHSKGKKIRVSTYRAKSRYHKTKGSRHQYTTVMIKKIEYKAKQKS